MQTLENFFIDIHRNISEENLGKLPLSLQKGDILFFYGDLGAGKSTLIRTLLRNYFSDSDLIVRSPTYTYYQKYGKNIYHFDLYRVENPEDLFLIGANDILENKENICLIEWPEILWESIIPSKKISITQWENGNRNIEIIYPSRDWFLDHSKASIE